MHYTTILFDLDGTLLPMDQDRFVTDYFGRLCQKLGPYGYEPKFLIENIWKGIAVMVNNDGSRTNEEAFWDFFTGVYGPKSITHKEIFEDFYRHEFQASALACGFDEKAARTVAAMQILGYETALATNPIFPAVATESRIRWAGLEPGDFTLYTTYEDTSWSKPNPAYFLDVAKRLGRRPEECLMVGNDVDEDMIAASSIGMGVFLITDCMINKEDKDISGYPRGGFDDLLDYVKSLTEEEEDHG